MKRDLRYLLLVALWAMIAMPVVAQQVSVADAMRSARQFLSGSSSSVSRVKANMPLSLAYTSEQNGKAHYYIFNCDSEDGGFVIVGADEAAVEILGYSDSGTFDYATAPDNMKWWLSQYDLQIAEGIRQGINSRTVVKSKISKAAARNNIDALIQTKWNQSAPYNNLIPTFNSSYTFVTGCVATAVAQIMKYYNYPTSGVGSKSYTITYTVSDTEYPVPFSADFGNTVYDWDNMLNTYTSGNYNDTQANAVATLMYHVGVSANMKYNTAASGGSGASTEVATASLVDIFGYDKSYQCLYRSDYTDDEWEEIVYNELAEGRPVLYSGQSSTGGGHAFICDGYDSKSSTYHFNWGWGGLCDGTYALQGTGALQPDGNGIGGAGTGSAYTIGQGISINVKPDEGGDYVYEVGWGFYDITPSLSSSSVSRGTAVTVNGSISNRSLVTISCDLGVRLTNGSTTIDKKVGAISNLGPGYYYYNYFPTMQTSDVPEGTYTVQLLFKVGTGDWQVAKVPAGVDLPELTITACTDNYLITTVPTFGNGEYVTTDKSKIFLTFMVKNNTDADINKTFDFPVYPPGGGYNQSYFSTSVTLPANAEIEVKVPCIRVFYDFEVGDGYFAIFNGSRYYFNVVDEKPITFPMTSAGWGTLILPYDADVPEGLTVMTCSSMDGTTLNLTADTKIRQFTPYIVSGTEGNYEFNGPDVPGKQTYKHGLLTGIMDSEYLLQEDDYVLQKKSGVLGFYQVGTGTMKGKKATANRCVLNPLLRDAWNDVALFPSGNEATSIESVENVPIDTQAVEIFSISGTKQNNLQRGINIVRLSDGRVVKVISK